MRLSKIKIAVNYIDKQLQLPPHDVVIISKVFKLLLFPHKRGEDITYKLSGGIRFFEYLIVLTINQKRYGILIKHYVIKCDGRLLQLGASIIQ